MEIKHFIDRTEYHFHGKRHREDGPARIWSDGDEEWFIDGKLHREDGPATIAQDSKRWYLDGMLHRINAPAIEFNDGDSSWYHNDLKHRLDGPATDWKINKQWYLKGVQYTVQNYHIIRSVQIVMAISPLQLPAYLVLWILEWILPNIVVLIQPRLVQMIQNIRNRLKNK